MLLCLVYAAFAACGTVLNKPISPGETITFREIMGADDQQLVLSLANLSKSPRMRFRIIAPQGAEHSSSEDESEDTFGDVLSSNMSRHYDTPGLYTIQISNPGRSSAEFQISSYVYKKVNDTNKDVVELRNLLYALQTTMDTLGNENYYLRSHQAQSISEARFVLRTMNWLILFPILTVLIGYLKYVFARQLVKPKGKRFRGLF